MDWKLLSIEPAKIRTGGLEGVRRLPPRNFGRRKETCMEENTGYNPLQPVFELIQGGDPDRICLKFGISRGQLDKMLLEYQTSRRKTALAESLPDEAQ